MMEINGNKGGTEPVFEPADGDEDELFRNDPLRDAFVWWDDITQDQVTAFEKFLDGAPGERAIHKYLEANPYLLVQSLTGGHGRYVLSRSWLGQDMEIDFLVGEKHSGGFDWLLVELEDCATALYKENGDPGLRLKHAMQQIINCRQWLEKNLDYAERPKDNQGLGLTSIGARPSGLVLMGREKLLRAGDGDRRREERRDRHIRVQTYDWLLRNAQDRADAMERWRSKQAKP